MFLSLSKCPWTFGKMDLKSSKFEMCVLFKSIKRNFFQKVAFSTNQTLFLGWLFSKRDFWTEKVETNGHLIEANQVQSTNLPTRQMILCLKVSYK